jgi:hypothetical protein
VKLWPLRVGVEFDSASPDLDYDSADEPAAAWWLPQIECWKHGFRVGVLGLHLFCSIGPL